MHGMNNIKYVKTRLLKLYVMNVSV